MKGETSLPALDEALPTLHAMAYIGSALARIPIDLHVSCLPMRSVPLSLAAIKAAGLVSPRSGLLTQFTG